MSERVMAKVVRIDAINPIEGQIKSRLLKSGDGRL